MKKILRNCGLLLLVFIATARSQSTPFRFERQLIPGGSGANRIAPDVTLLGGVAASDLRDLRLYDSSGQEVPYLLIPPENPKPRWKTKHSSDSSNEDVERFRSGFRFGLCN